MFSHTVEYALRAMVVVSNHPGEPRTAQQIAAASQVPVDYLFKVMQSLGRAGLVTSQRGKNGGFTLTRPASGVTILEVVNAVEPIKRIQYCPLNLPNHGTRLCALHRKMDTAMKMVEDVLSTTTLEELLEGPAQSRPLCGGLETIHAHAH